MSRKKMGIEKRSVIIGVKVSPGLRQLIDDAALKEGFTVSTFIHRIVKQYLEKQDQ